MASLVFKHKSYYAVFSVNSRKKWIRLGKLDKKEARKALKHLEIEFLKGKLNIREIKQITLYDFLEHYLKYSKTNKARSTYKRELEITRNIKTHFGNILLMNMDNRSIEGYKASRVSQGIKPATINRELTVLSDMLKKAHQWNHIEKVPSFAIMKLSKNPPHFLSVEEINRLLECSSAWLRPIIIVLRNTGMRIGEVLGLRFSDIDLENKVILVRSTKTNNYRVVPINGELEETLEWLSSYYVNPSSLRVSIRHANQKVYLFCLPDGSRVRCIKTSFNKASARAGIKATPHTIRHTFASHLVMNQVDLVSIKELLGHSSISTTMIYSHVSREYKEKTVSRLPWVNRVYRGL